MDKVRKILNMHRTGHATKLPLLIKKIITRYQRFQKNQKILHPVFEEQKSVESMNIWSNETDSVKTIYCIYSNGGQFLSK